jgi:hypothetical protein
MVRLTLARNLRALMNAHEDRNTIEKLVLRGGGTNGTIGRMLKGDTSSRIDAVTQVARVFNLQAWQLLVPNLDPAHPPALEMDTRRAEILAAELENIARRIGTIRRD